MQKTVIVVRVAILAGIFDLDITLGHNAILIILQLIVLYHRF